MAPSINIPATWRPTLETQGWAVTETAKYGVTLDLDYELDFFRDYYIARTEIRFPDWNPVFRNWLRRSISTAAKSAKVSSATVKEAQKYADIKRARPGDAL